MVGGDENSKQKSRPKIDAFSFVFSHFGINSFRIDYALNKIHEINFQTINEKVKRITVNLSDVLLII